MQTTKNLGLRKPEENDFFNVDDFNNNSDVVDALFEKDANGSVVAKNASKLDGHEAEYFAPLGTLKNAMKSYQYDGGTANDDETLNSLLQSFHDNATDLTHYQNGIYISYQSPFSGGHKWIEGYRQSANYGWQKITYWQNGCPREYWRSLYAGTWLEWFKVPDINDLAKHLSLDGSAVNINPVNDLNNFSTGIAIFSDSTANKPGDGWWLVVAGGQANSTASQIAFDLLQNKGPKQRRCASGTWYAWDDAKSNCLPLTGGTLTDSLFVKRTDNNSVMLGVENALNKLHSGVNGSGVAYMQDKNGNVIVCNTDGTRTFNGTASGNVASVDGTAYLAGHGGLTIQRTGGAVCTPKYVGNGNLLGYLGFSEKDKPTFIDTNGSYLDLLHTGNGATYEEGTFDLTVGNAAVLSGYKYTKIGKFVYLSGTVSYNGEAIDLSSGVDVSGLPFAMNSIPYLYFGTDVYIASNVGTNNLANFIGSTLGTTFQIGKSGASLANGAPCVLHAMYITD